MSIMQLGNIRAEAGEKACGMFVVPGIDYEMPVTVINGKTGGKTVLVTAGIHACEYVGIQAAIELARDLDPNEVAGGLVVIHPVNASGFRRRIPALLPEAGENLNRLFPGDADGGFGERLAYALTHEFQDKADFYLDLHGGDQSEELEPFVFYPGVANDAVVAESRRVAGVLNLRYMLKSGAVTGAYNSAARRGVPALLIERGGCGVWTTEEVELYKNDVLSALFALGVYPHNPNEKKVYEPKEVRNPLCLASEYAGCWYPSVKAGDFVEKGCVLGEIRDFFGNALMTHHAKISGVVLYRAASLSVEAGTELVAYAEIAGE